MVIGKSTKKLYLLFYGLLSFTILIKSALESDEHV